MDERILKHQPHKYFFLLSLNVNGKYTTLGRTFSFINTSSLYVSIIFLSSFVCCLSLSLWLLCYSFMVSRATQKKKKSSHSHVFFLFTVNFKASTVSYPSATSVHLHTFPTALSLKLKDGKFLIRSQKVLAQVESLSLLSFLESSLTPPRFLLESATISYVFLLHKQ